MLASFSSRRAPSVPNGLRIYAIGDIHGRVDLLDKVLSRIDSDLTKNPIGANIQVFLGDYIDRGPASSEVIDRLMARDRLHQMVFLKGNHESYLMRFVQDPPVIEDWQQLGGFETLMSYGIMPDLELGYSSQKRLSVAFNEALPTSHKQFFKKLRLSFTCGDFFFVHAGVRPGVKLTEQAEQDLLWIRQDFLLYEEKFSKMIVHGHTPVSEPDVRLNRINIDTGAYATGLLTCLKLQNDSMEFL